MLCGRRDAGRGGNHGTWWCSQPGGRSLLDYCLVRGDVSIAVGTADRTLTFLLEGEVT